MPFSVNHRPLLLAVLAVSLSSCSILPARVASSPPPPPPPESSLGEPVPALDPAGIPGALPESLRTGTATPVSARWVYLSGAESYNNRLDAGLLGLFDHNAGGRYDPSVPDPAVPLMDRGLKLDHAIIATGDAMVGTRMTRWQVDRGTESLVSVTTEFTNLSTGEILPGAALISSDSNEKIRQLLGEAIAAETKSSAPSDNSPTTSATPASTAPASSAPAAVPPPVQALLSGAAFSPVGDLVVPLTIDPTNGAPLTDPVTVHITAKSSTRLLSDLGSRMQQLATAPRPLTPLTLAAAGQEHVNCDLVPCAALTYDDGPNEQTKRLLGVLASRKIHATFFQQGIYVATHPQISAAAAADGHVLANHTMRHPDLTKLSAAGVREEIQGTSAIINKMAGVAPAYLRPPYGASNARVNTNAGLPLINWSVDSLDWQSRNKDIFVPKILKLVKPGAIILQHDIHASTVDGQDQLITSLQGMGYHLVTVPQLFHGIELQNGRAYFCRGTVSPCTPGR
ncbi:polysaccharide deacetylase family protein [Arthrobacter glacialis]|uniref:polysaccharide deacetylase family protein n=1 Tax=Arthrobacter glacialis TaxID=1664 RepID=UPI000CD3CB9D|nr:polysaccharide deacetylase family protein [Arthrobacter glacialis]POH57644.1 polysaccharide deacetylase [Arthrobacter glacialis]